MELLGVLVAVILAIAALNRATSYENRIRRLESLIEETRKAPLAAPPSEPRSETQTWPAPSPAIASKPSAMSDELEALIGEKVLNRIGAVALIIGTGFFLKYAFDHDWIGPTARVIMGLVTGAGLVALATRQRERLPIFAQGVLGAGISILYLSTFAAFEFYRLIPHIAAVLSMSAVTLIAFERAVRFDSFAVALLAWAGGFLTPVMLSGGRGAADPSRLFIYLVVLNAGLVALAVRKSKWWGLEPISLIATYGIYLGQHLSAFSEGNAWVSFVFLTGIWAIYYAADLTRIFRRQDSDQFLSLTGSIGTAFYFWAGGVVVHSMNQEMLALFALALSAAHGIPLVVLRRSIGRHAFKAAVLLITATTLQFDGFLLAIILAGEALGILLIGILTRTLHLRLFGLSAFAYTIVVLLGTPGAVVTRPLDARIEIVTPRIAAFLALAIAMAVGAFAHKNVDEPELSTRSGVDELARPEVGQALLHFGWTFIVFLLIGIEVFDRLSRFGFDRGTLMQAGLIAAVAWAGYALALTSIGIGRVATMVQSGTAILVIATVTVIGFGFSYFPVTSFTAVLNQRALSMLVVIAVLYLAMRLLQSEEILWQSAMAEAFRIGIGILSFVLVTSETHDYFERLIALEGTSAALVDQLENMQQFALSGVWLVYSIVAIGLGIWRRITAFRIAGISLLGLTILKVFLYDLSFLADLYRIFSFLGLGVILLIASWAYQRYRSLIFG